MVLFLADTNSNYEKKTNLGSDLKTNPELIIDNLPYLFQ